MISDYNIILQLVKKILKLANEEKVEKKKPSVLGIAESFFSPNNFQA